VFDRLRLEQAIIVLDVDHENQVLRFCVRRSRRLLLGTRSGDEQAHVRDLSRARLAYERLQEGDAHLVSAILDDDFLGDQIVDRVAFAVFCQDCHLREPDFDAFGSRPSGGVWGSRNGGDCECA
jgi:hypothetical protein